CLREAAERDPVRDVQRQLLVACDDSTSEHALTGIVTRALALIASAVVLGGVASIHAQTPADTARYAVSYVEVMPAARATAVAALKQYREASRREDGSVRLELLEQIGRPGHFAIVETWKDQQTFDAHGLAAPLKQVRDALQSIRLSDYDQRPYKTLTVAPVTAAGNSNA